MDTEKKEKKETKEINKLSLLVVAVVVLALIVGGSVYYILHQRKQIDEMTQSFDLEKEVDAVYPTEHITRALVEEALKGFVGTIQQVPPVFSACKVEGKRAYELARQGEAVELKSKTLVIDELELLAYDMPYIKIRVVCSKGTYIRALARDIGQALRSGAHLTELIRTRVGEVTLDQCMSPEEIDDFLEENGVIKVEENNK